MGEPSNASMHLNFFQPEPTDRCDQLQDAVHYCTQIVNNNIMEDFIYTRDDGSIRTALWNPNNPKYIQSGSIVAN
ncbi:hypothetical protein H5410_064230 [Solanum commersonii]|uniref:Uncharacterized protein n=1 Tax=Solanum commersonii TaxID=4109 RepID=A0A9J5W0R0_SOLCO|nr:hypothetical protein H5410_064230 [Solanum commersonii]